MNIGQAIDKLYKAVQLRKVVQQKVKDMKTEEDKLESFIFKQLGTLALMRGSGKVANASISKLVVPNVTDKNKFYEYGKLKANFDLLTVGISSQAWRERHDDGKAIPGVKAFTKVSLSVTKKQRK